MDYEEWYRSNKILLCKNTPKSHEFLLELHTKGLVNEVKMAEIKRKEGPALQCEALYDHLVRFGLGRVGDIVHCLEERENYRAAEIFKECLTGAVQEPGTGPAVFNPLWSGMGIDKIGKLGYHHPEAPLSNPDLTRVLHLVMDDPLAKDGRWLDVVDQIVKSPSDQLHIKELFRNAKFPEAVMESLEIWYSHGPERADLVRVLREHGINSLADKFVKVIEPSSDKSLHALGSSTGSSIDQKIDTQPTLPKIGIETELEPPGSILFNVRELEANFVGREKELEMLHKIISESHSTRSSLQNIVCLSGLGGAGKSALARKYAIQYRDFFGGNAIWINGESRASMRHSFGRLAETLRLEFSDEISDQELAMEVFGQFRSKACLFIFDNVEDDEDFEPFEPRIEGPRYHTPHVLVTSRRTDLTPIAANILRLKALSLDEAVQLIQNQLVHSTESKAEELVVELGQLPLALQQAVAHIKSQRGGSEGDDQAISDYLLEFSKESKKMLSDEGILPINGYAQTTFAAITATLKNVRQNQGGEMINVLAYMNPEKISSEFLSEIFRKETRLLLRIVEKFSMININGTRVDINGLVLHVVRLTLDSHEEQRILKRIVDVLKEELDQCKDTELTVECTSHGFHLFQYQRKYVDFVRQEFRYLDSLCLYLNRYGNSVKSLRLGQECSEILESAYGLEQESTLSLKYQVANAHSKIGNDDEASTILEEILPVCKETLGDEHWLTLRALRLKARILSKSPHENGEIDDIIDALLRSGNERVAYQFDNRKKQCQAKYGLTADPVPTPSRVPSAKASSTLMPRRQSEVNDSYSITESYWVVSLARKPDCPRPEHAFLIVEGTLDGEAKLWFMDFLSEEGWHYGTHSGRIRLYTFGCPLHGYPREKRNLLIFSRQELNDSQMMNLKFSDKIISISWQVTATKVLQMIQRINAVIETRAFPKFIVTEKDTIFEAVSEPFSLDGEGGRHNCFTWARAQLATLRDPLIDERLEHKGQFDWFVRISSNSLPEREPKRSMVVIWVLAATVCAAAVVAADPVGFALVMSVFLIALHLWKITTV